MGLLDALNKKKILEPVNESAPQETVKDDVSVEEKVSSFRLGSIKKESPSVASSVSSSSAATVEVPSYREPEPQYADIYEGAEGKGANVRIIAPKSYDHVQTIGREILGKKTVILKLGKLNEDTGSRILDFVYGVCFAQGIEPVLVDDAIYLIDASVPPSR